MGDLSTKVLVIVGVFGFGCFTGVIGSNKFHSAEQAEALKVAIAAKDKAQKRADELSRKLSVAESQVNTRTIEVIRYVPRYTKQRPCLTAGAVELLQPSADPSVVPASERNGTSGEEAASDTDVAYWIAEANRHYEVCAERLDSLITWAEGEVSPQQQ